MKANMHILFINWASWMLDLKRCIIIITIVIIVVIIVIVIAVVAAFFLLLSLLPCLGSRSVLSLLSSSSSLSLSLLLLLLLLLLSLLPCLGSRSVRKHGRPGWQWFSCCIRYWNSRAWVWRIIQGAKVCRFSLTGSELWSMLHSKYGE